MSYENNCSHILQGQSLMITFNQGYEHLLIKKTCNEMTMRVVR